MLTSGERSVCGVHRRTISSTGTSTNSGLVEKRSSFEGNEMINRTLANPLQAYRIKVNFNFLVAITVFVVVHLAGFLYELDEL